jgi:hypothetical protein
MIVTVTRSEAGTTIERYETVTVMPRRLGHAPDQWGLGERTSEITCGETLYTTPEEEPRQSRREPWGKLHPGDQVASHLVNLVSETSCFPRS